MTEEQFKQAQEEIFKRHSFPASMRSWAMGYAWEQGHSAGYEEVLGDLSELVSSMSKSLEEYGDQRFIDGQNSMQLD